LNESELAAIESLLLSVYIQWCIFLATPLLKGGLGSCKHAPIILSGGEVTEDVGVESRAYCRPVLKESPPLVCRSQPALLSQSINQSCIVTADLTTGWAAGVSNGLVGRTVSGIPGRQPRDL